MNRGFDKDGFMAYLHETFNGFENPWLRELVENVIAYVEANEDSSSIPVNKSNNGFFIIVFLSM